jgi:hypothetical protein
VNDSLIAESIALIRAYTAAMAAQGIASIQLDVAMSPYFAASNAAWMRLQLRTEVLADNGRDDLAKKFLGEALREGHAAMVGAARMELRGVA